MNITQLPNGGEIRDYGDRQVWYLNGERMTEQQHAEKVAAMTVDEVKSVTIELTPEQAKALEDFIWDNCTAMTGRSDHDEILSAYGKIAVAASQIEAAA